MTKIAILAATAAELEPVKARFGDKYIYSVTGIGVLETAISTLKTVAEHHPNLLLQVGIAGAVSREIELLQAVVVSRDYIADMGAWRGEAGFEKFDTTVIEYPYIVDGFDSVRARTVTTACANWIADDSQIETMEGAAFMAAAASQSVRFMQLRVISNYIDTPRKEWLVPQAIEAIPDAIAKLL